MKVKQRIVWTITTLVMGTGLIATSTNAQPPNQSDITGTNIWNNTAPIFDQDGELDPAILENARRLDQALEDAAEGCCDAVQPEAPRRFAREPGNPNPACADCLELNRLVEETEIFLDEVNRTQGARVNASRNRLW
ncbi:MAG: hypothetical protein RIG63_28815 [Coleofasciculus chthonoplastes F3-SA18-01]|uniref:hypothetical protein n=1 Tax=Coleofasciculus chthonoplastes TaxID=64178 RepID=UPI0032F37FAA